MLKLKLQYFGHVMWRTDSLEKILMLGKIEARRRQGWRRMRWLDGMTYSPQQTWVWVSSGSWWWTGKPGVLQSMGLQRARHDWVTTELREHFMEWWAWWGTEMARIWQKQKRLKRGGKNKQNYTKGINDPNYCNGVFTHLEPDIIESEVKCALGSISANKVSRGDGILADSFKILKDDTVKVLHSIRQQIWKTQQWPQNWQWSVFIPIPNNVQLSYNCTHFTC